MQESEASLVGDVAAALITQGNLPAMPMPLTRAELEAWLAPQLLQLVRTDFAALLQLMYWLDVPEDQFIQAMNTDDMAAAAHTLAGLVVARELQKAKTRRKYKSSEN